MANHPFRITFTRILQTAAIIGIGDASAQAIEIRPHSADELVAKFDYKRNGQMVAFGVFNNGIAVPFWLRTLWTRVGPGRDLATVGKKIVLDQSIYAPAMVAGVLGYTAVCKEMNNPKANDGGSVERIKEDFEFNIRTKALEIYLCDCLVWPLASFINYSLLPERYMVSFYSVITVAWNCYLSWRSWQFKDIDAAPSSHLPVVVATASAESVSLPLPLVKDHKSNNDNVENKNNKNA